MPTPSLRSAGLACLMGLLAGSLAQASDKRPNFLFLMSDDQGWGDVGYYGHPTLKTPALDAMAAAGMRFDRFYAASPVCSPTRASCLTGRHGYRTGVWRARSKQNFRNEETTIAELLVAEGYQTGFFGKWHFRSPIENQSADPFRFDRGVLQVDRPWNPALHEDNVVTPWSSGFQVSFTNFECVPTCNPLKTPEYPYENGLRGRVPGTPYGRPYFSQRGDAAYLVHRDGLTGPTPKINTDPAVEFIRQAASEDAPWLCLVWFHTPHSPIVATDEHRALYPGLTDDEQHWYGALTAMDEQIGRLRQLLRDLGESDNTVVWFCSDNGPSMPKEDRCKGTTNGLRGKKGNLFEGGVRVPGLVEWPGKIRPGSVSKTPLGTSDYLPMTLHLAGVTSDAELQPLDGLDMTGVLFETVDQRPEPICFRHFDEYAVVDNRFKIHSKRGEAPALYDLFDDPAETTDVAEQNPGVYRRLTRVHKEWDTSCRVSLARLDYKTTNRHSTPER